MAMHDLALEPWSIELSATPVQEERTMDLGSSTELITLKPWDPGKQLPLGFSVLGQASSTKQSSSSVHKQKAQAANRATCGCTYIPCANPSHRPRV